MSQAIAKSPDPKHPRPEQRRRGRPPGSGIDPLGSGLAPAALRVPQAANYLNVSEGKIWRMLNEGKLESVRIDNCRLILRRSLDRLLGITD